jgi:hypothetical protein
MMGPHSMKLLSTSKASFQPAPRFPAPWPLPPTSIPTATLPPLCTSQATQRTRRPEVQTPVAKAATPNDLRQLPPIIPQSPRTPIANTFSVPPPPAIHRGVVCDHCEKTIEGVRHKCLDCPGESYSLDCGINTYPIQIMTCVLLAYPLVVLNAIIPSMNFLKSPSLAALSCTPCSVGRVKEPLHPPAATGLSFPQRCQLLWKSLSFI